MFPALHESSRAVLLLGLVAGLVLALPGCKDARPGASSPHDALQCQLTAIKARDADQMAACFHPTVRDAVKTSLGQKPPPWDTMAEKAKVLADVKPSDFTVEAATAEQQLWGERTASWQVGEDSFVAVEREGRWFIVDSGL